MTDFFAHIYVITLAAVMLCAVFSFILVSLHLRKSDLPSVFSAYFLSYFVAAGLGWPILYLRDIDILDVGPAIRAALYLLYGLSVYLAIGQWKRPGTVGLIVLLHVATFGLFLWMPSVRERMLVTDIYGLLIFSHSAWIAFAKALRLNNLGYGLIGTAALVALLPAPYALYLVIFHNEVYLAYGAMFVGGAAGFVMTGIGFLTAILIERNHQLSALALKDPLTGLLNRRGLDYAVMSMVADIRRNQLSVSAIAVDIDHFKAINDRYGHNGGDHVLREFAQLLVTFPRGSDICCRFGGEEFVIVLPGTTNKNARTIAERIRQSIAEKSFEVNGEHTNLTASIGIATQEGDLDLDGLFKKADKALYSAKVHGRNQVCSAY